MSKCWTLDGPTFDTVHFDPLADIHHLDKRSFVGGDGVVHGSLVADTFPVVCDCLFCVPSGILGGVSACVCGRGGRGTDVGRRELDAADVGGDDILLVTEALCGSQHPRDRATHD